MVIVAICLIITTATLVFVISYFELPLKKQSRLSRLENAFLESALASKAIHDLTKDAFIKMADFAQKQTDKNNQTDPKQGKQN